MLNHFAILVVVSSVLSVTMSAPTYGGNYDQQSGGQFTKGTARVDYTQQQGPEFSDQQHHGTKGGQYVDHPGHGQVQVKGTHGYGTKGGNYEHPQQGHLEIGGGGHNQQLGSHGHGQLGFGVEPGQQAGHQHGGQYNEQGNHGGGYQTHGY